MAEAGADEAVKRLLEIDNNTMRGLQTRAAVFVQIAGRNLTPPERALFSLGVGLEKILEIAAAADPTVLERYNKFKEMGTIGSLVETGQTETAPTDPAKLKRWWKQVGLEVREIVVRELGTNTRGRGLKPQPA